MSLGVPEWLFIGLAYVAGATVLAIAAFALTDLEAPSWLLREVPSPGSAAARSAGSWRQRATVRQYLDTIGESFIEDDVVEGVHCAFYLPDRDVAVTFDPGTYQALRTSATFVVFLEGGFSGFDLGERLPFDTPSAEWARQQARAGTGTGTGRATGRRTGQHRGQERRRTGRGGGRQRQRRAGAGNPQASEREVRQAFRTLGIPRDADEEAVKAAYREKIKDVHPDHGGSEEAFGAVQEAYATAREHAASVS